MGRMKKEYRLYQVDSFTKEKFTGNPAGVIANAEGLSVDEMQSIARELNNSETAFIFPSRDDSYDVEVRFFTPTNEVPICGHATIAAHYVRSIEEGLDSGITYQKTGAGILPVECLKEDSDYRIIMTQGEIEFGHILTGDKSNKLLRALGIESEDLIPQAPIQIVSTGHSKVMIGIQSLEQLNSLKPNNELLSALSEEIKCNGYYVFVLGEEEDILVHGRMFAPAIGINEDPVTGNANGPLGAYLVDKKMVDCKDGLFKFKVKQGVAMKRPGIIEVEVRVVESKPVQVKVSGHAVVVFQSTIEV